MNIIGTVVLVSIYTPVKKKDGGTYPGWKLVYQDVDGEVKTIQKHMNSLKYAAALKNGLEALKPGDSFTLEQEKEGDFWNPKNVYKNGEDIQAPASSPKANAQQGKQTVTPSNSTYATKEERAQTQVYIVKQSSLANALKFLELIGNKKATTRDVISLAQEFEAYVFNQAPKELTNLGKSTYYESLEDLDDDIPF